MLQTLHRTDIRVACISLYKGSFYWLSSIENLVMRGVSCRHCNLRKRLANENTWVYKVLILFAFVVPRSYENKELARFVANNVASGRNGTLDSMRAKKLQSLDLYWGRDDDEGWHAYYDCMKAHCGIEKMLDASRPPEGSDIGDWMRRQLYFYKKGVLREDRKRKLEEIGFFTNSRKEVKMGLRRPLRLVGQGTKNSIGQNDKEKAGDARTSLASDSSKDNVTADKTTGNAVHGSMWPKCPRAANTQKIRSASSRESISSEEPSSEDEINLTKKKKSFATMKGVKSDSGEDEEVKPKKGTNIASQAKKLRRTKSSKTSLAMKSEGDEDVCDKNAMKHTRSFNHIRIPVPKKKDSQKILRNPGDDSKGLCHIKKPLVQQDFLASETIQGSETVDQLAKASIAKTLLDLQSSEKKT